MSTPVRNQQRSADDTLIAVAGWTYFPIAFFARLPYAMMVVGVMTLVVAARGSITLAGLTSALVGVGAATVGPILGNLADRHGQRPVLLVVGLCNAAFLLAIAAVAYSALPGWTLPAIAFFVGGTAPQVSPMSRSRLVEIIRQKLPKSRLTRTMSFVMSYESAVDEIVFVFGPVLVGLLATLLGAGSPLIAAAILTVAFVSAFALHPSAGLVQPSKHRSADSAPVAPMSSILRLPLILCVIGMTGIGIFFGSTLTSLTSYMESLGQPDSAGLWYGVLGVGSTILALAIALAPPTFTLRARWVTFGSIMVAGSLIYALAGNLLFIGVALLVAGIGIGPTLVTLYSLAADIAPEGRAATVMTIMGSGLIVGQSIASAITGFIAGQLGTAAGMWVPLAAAAIVLVSGLVSLSTTRRSHV